MNSAKQLKNNLQYILDHHQSINSQMQLAKAMDIDYNHLNRMLNGHHSPRLNRLTAIADTLKVPVYWLLLPANKLVQEMH